MKKALLIINLILPFLSSSLHGQKAVETKRIVTNLIRGQYELDGGIGLSDKYLGGYQSGRFILEISIDPKTKANYCWIQQQIFEKEYNPNLIRNGVNLSNNYSWNTVDGSYASGTYKINPIDSSVTFTWKKKYQNILPKAKLKKMNYDLILEVAKDNYFVKGFDYEDGEMYRSKSRLEQISFDEKQKAEKLIVKEKRLLAINANLTSNTKNVKWTDGEVLVSMAPSGYARYDAIDLTGYKNLAVSLKFKEGYTHGGRLEIRTESILGPLLGSVEVFEYKDYNFPININGIHDIYLVFMNHKEEKGVLFLLSDLTFRN